MIDAFWTTWRVRRLYRGEAGLVGKWLDDYVSWLYGRLWVLSGQDAAKAEKALTDALLSAVSHLDQQFKSPRPMSEWLLTFIDPHTFTPSRPTEQSPEVQNQIRSLWTHSVAETTMLSPEVIDLSQKALAVVGKDDQEALIRRYLRMETAADVLGELYRARHSFRRSLESLAVIDSVESPSLVLADQDVLDANLEKLFSSLGPKPSPSAELSDWLKAKIVDILLKRKAADFRSALWLWVTPAAAAVVLCVVWIAIVVYQSDKQNDRPNAAVATQGKSKNSAKPTEPSLSDMDIAELVKQAAAMGEHHDAEGLIEILANGPYAAQLIAAHYLGRFGDKSAIDPLDVASQKWHPNAPSESNPFVDAIAAIEARAKEEQRQMELEAKKQKILEKTLPLIRSRLEKTEPNAPGTTSIAADANAISSEPNTFAAASSAAEPNQPAMDPHAAVPADANQLADSNSAM